MKTKKPTAAHLEFRTEALELLRKHSGHLPSDEILAMAAHMVGQILAMQDQRKMTREMALEVVSRNIEVGNAEAIQALSNTQGTA